MTKKLLPVKKVGGTITVPGDKSIAHRAALLSILSKGPLTIKNFPDAADCQMSLAAARRFGVNVEEVGDTLVLRPPEKPSVETDAIVDCGNSGTTARLLAGIVAGSDGLTVTLSGDESLSRRPMKRIIDPLSEMGAEFFADDGHLPMKISGKRLLPFEYRLPLASAQVKSAILLAGMASSCSVTVREDIPSRDHTERMIQSLGEGLTARKVTPLIVPDPDDPRKKRREMPESFKREVVLSSRGRINGGTVDIPGDFSTAAFFFAAAAISKKTITVESVGLNPTRTGFLEHLRLIGCTVETAGKVTVGGEPRGKVTITGAPLRARKLSGETVTGLLDELPIVAVMAAFSEGTTIIRDASELKVKESDRLMAVADNLKRMGVKCGLLDDGLVIEGGKDLSGADFRVFGDHRIAMAFSVASLFLVGPSTIDDHSVVTVSCPGFYDLLNSISQ
ncbi:MAG: 3-phosphoshikimate 1-carboxyvinyltransferase [candidate division Zixibacteria bacterium]|nr:3-phosphoshikimate 1-carboxyvinyltransferase [candidate division Zixibacteria bacterium]